MEGGGNSVTEGRRHKVILAIVLLLSVRAAMQRKLEAEQATLVTLRSFTAFLHICQNHFRLVSMRRRRNVWRHRRDKGFYDRALVASNSEREFIRRVRVHHNTFQFLCSVLAPELAKQKRGGNSISIENQVGLSLNRLGTRNYLLSCADVWGMSEATASIVVRRFCAAVKKILRPMVVPVWSQDNIKKLASSFEKLHGIPLIMGAIDCSHIPIIAPSFDAQSYYNRKGFHSALLHGVVDTQTMFWDWDYGWSGAVHDYTVFRSSQLGIRVGEGRYYPYKLVGDAAYPVRPYFYVPFKGQKEELPAVKQHWNFIQSSTRMCVERAFGLLKSRWRILLRKIEMPLHHTPDVVAACLCLHNLCIYHQDWVSIDDMCREARETLEADRMDQDGELREAAIQHIVDYGNLEVTRTTCSVENLMEIVTAESDNDHFYETKLKGADDVQLLHDGQVMHTLLSENLYQTHIEKVTLPVRDGFFSEGETESEGAVMEE